MLSVKQPLTFFGRFSPAVYRSSSRSSEERLGSRCSEKQSAADCIVKCGCSDGDCINITGPTWCLGWFGELNSGFSLHTDASLWWSSVLLMEWIGTGLFWQSVLLSPSIHLFFLIHPFVHLSVHFLLSIHPLAYPFIYLFVYPGIHLYVHFFIQPSIYLFVHCQSIYLSIHLSVY